MVRIARILTCFSPVPWAKQLAVPREADRNLQQPSLPGRGDLGGGGVVYLLEYLVNSTAWDQPALFLSLTTPPCALSLLGKRRGPRGSQPKGESARSWGDFSSCAQNQRGEKLLCCSAHEVRKKENVNTMAQTRCTEYFEVGQSWPPPPPPPSRQSHFCTRNRHFDPSKQQFIFL